MNASRSPFYRAHLIIIKNLMAILWKKAAASFCQKIILSPCRGRCMSRGKIQPRYKLKILQKPLTRYERWKRNFPAFSWNFDRLTWPADRPTNKLTGMRVHREIKYPPKCKFAINIKDVFLYLSYLVLLRIVYQPFLH